MLDSLDRRQLRQLDQILDAAHTYTNWLDGQPTASTDLAHAVDTLTTVARHAPAFATDTVDRNQWNQLPALAPHNHLDRSRPTPEIDLW